MKAQLIVKGAEDWIYVPPYRLCVQRNRSLKALCPHIGAEDESRFDVRSIIHNAFILVEYRYSIKCFTSKFTTVVNCGNLVCVKYKKLDKTFPHFPVLGSIRIVIASREFPEFTVVTANRLEALA
jgi:hypothetical protein